MNSLSAAYSRMRVRAAGWKGPLRYYISRLGGSPDAFLKLCHRGVIHIGANVGNERFLYSENRLKVIWIEPIPNVYQELVRNITPYKDQMAFNALLTDRDSENYTFHISSNAGYSSSIFDLHHHLDIWPTIHYVRDIEMMSVTLKTLLDNGAIPYADYDALVMDTQGSELLVLKGAGDVLSSIRFIKTEAADFEIYKGCCTGDELCAFLKPLGFHLILKHEFAKRVQGGTCFELVFARDVPKAQF